jgi:hypothetical protein
VLERAWGFKSPLAHAKVRRFLSRFVGGREPNKKASGDPGAFLSKDVLVRIQASTVSGSRRSATIGAYAGLPARYEALPLEAIASFGDTAEMFRWFTETPAYQADFDATRALVPDALDLPSWLAASGWHLSA